MRTLGEWRHLLSLVCPIVHSYQCAFKHVISIRAGRDAGPYRYMVAAGLRAPHSYLLGSELVSEHTLVRVPSTNAAYGRTACFPVQWEPA